MVIADALAVAKRLQFTFVEPVLRNGRVVNPFNWQEQELIPLRMMMDVDALKKFYPNWISIEEFMASCAAGGKGMPRMHIEDGKDRTHLKKNGWPSGKPVTSETVNSLRKSKEQISAMNGFRRNFHRDGVGFASQDGVPIKTSEEIVRIAERVRQTWGNHVDYACVQWRSELVGLNAEERMQCAHTLVEAVLPMVKNKKVLLLSDVRPNTSGTTYKNENATSLKQCASFLQDQLHFEEVVLPLELFNDTGLQALVEMRLCAASSMMVGCPTEAQPSQCTSCSYMPSKFAASILALRKELGLPAAVAW